MCGYGDTCKGCAEALNAMGAHVSIIEIDPICAMQAHIAGYPVIDHDIMRENAEIIVTATGCPETLNMEDFNGFGKNPLLVNMGNSKVDFSPEDVDKSPGVERTVISEHITEYHMPDGSGFKVLCDGNIANIQSGGGHPPKVMSITFTGTVLSLLDFHINSGQYCEKRVYKLPRRLDEECARFNFPEMKLTKLTPEQAEHLNVDVDGPYKREDYRY